MNKEPKWYGGIVRIGLPSGNGRFSEGNIFTIELMDNLSGCQILEIEISAECFGKAIAGRSDQPIRFQLQGISRVGYRAEHRTESVEIPETKNWKTRQEEAAKFLAQHPLAKEGWVGDSSDACNHHCCQGKNTYLVTFRRHVHIETGEPFRA